MKTAKALIKATWVENEIVMGRFDEWRIEYRASRDKFYYDEPVYPTSLMRYRGSAIQTLVQHTLNFHKPTVYCFNEGRLARYK